MSKNTPRKIVIILDPEFPGDLMELWAVSDVCIVASESNSWTIEEARKAVNNGLVKKPKFGLTLIPWDQSSGLVGNPLAAVVDVAMEHYDDYTEVNPVARIEVLGSELTPANCRCLEEWGFKRFRTSRGGFVAETEPGVKS